MDNYLLLPKALASAVFYGCFAGAVGALLARLWLGESDDAEPLRRQLRACAAACSAVMAAVLPVQLWLLTAAMLATTETAQVRAMLPEVLTGTHAGRVLVPAFALALLLLCITLVRPLWRRSGGVWASLGVAAALAVVRSASGHASSDGDFTLREAVQSVHLASIAVWAGGVMVAGWLVLTKLKKHAVLVTTFGRRLSATVTWALLLIVLSGIYNAWQGLGGAAEFHRKTLWSGLAHSQWGLLLSGKSALVGVALLLGLRNRWLLRGRETLSEADTASLVGSMRWEALVMAAILLVTGALANSPPAMGQ